MVGAVRNFLSGVTGIVLSASAIMAPLVLDRAVALSGPQSLVGSFNVETNQVDVYQRRGLFNKFYSFKEGTNLLYSSSNWNSPSVRFEVGGNLVRSDSLLGPYEISSVPKTTALQREQN